MMETDDAGIHSGGNDRDRRARAARCEENFERWWAAFEAQENTWISRTTARTLWTEGWRSAEAETRHEGLDGVHSQQAP